MMKKIVIVDDHVLIAKALTAIIDQLGGFEVLYEVANGKQLMARFDTPRQIPDIVLLDVNMPEMNGFETAAWLKEHHPDVHILALSVQEEEQTLIRMLQQGAKGYLLKNTTPKELKVALDAIQDKGFYYPDWVSQALMRRATGNTEETKIILNRREKDFLQLAATEMTYKEIAEKMCVSPRTVEGYRDQLFERFGLKSRVSLVVFALKKQLITLE